MTNAMPSEKSDQTILQVWVSALSASCSHPHFVGVVAPDAVQVGADLISVLGPRGHIGIGPGGGCGALEHRGIIAPGAVDKDAAVDPVFGPGNRRPAHGDFARLGLDGQGRDAHGGIIL